MIIGDRFANNKIRYEGNQNAEIGIDSIAFESKFYRTSHLLPSPILGIYFWNLLRSQIAVPFISSNTTIKTIMPPAAAV